MTFDYIYKLLSSRLLGWEQHSLQAGWLSLSKDDIWNQNTADDFHNNILTTNFRMSASEKEFVALPGCLYPCVASRSSPWCPFFLEGRALEWSNITFKESEYWARQPPDIYIFIEVSFAFRRWLFVQEAPLLPWIMFSRKIPVQSAIL